MPATASDVTNASRIAGSAAPARRIADERADGEAVEAREPRAVGDAHAGERHARFGERRADDPRAGRASSRAARSSRRAP